MDRGGMVIGVEFSDEPSGGAPEGLVRSEGDVGASRRRWRARVLAATSWLVVFGGVVGLVALASDLANPIQTCPAWVVSDGGIPVGPGPADGDLYRALPASEVPGYEVTVQFVPPLVRCRPPGGGAWRSASASGMAALDRWTGPWVIGLAVLEAAAVTSLFFKVRQRRSKAA